MSNTWINHNAWTKSSELLDSKVILAHQRTFYEQVNYLYEELEFFANGEEIQIMIEAEHVDPTTRTTGIKNHGITLRILNTGRDFPAINLVFEDGIRRRWPSGHQNQNEQDQQQRNRNHQQHAPIPVDLVRKRLVLSATRSFNHLVAR